MRKLTGKQIACVGATSLLALMMSAPLVAQDTAPPPPAPGQGDMQGPPPPRGEGRGGMNPERRVSMLQHSLDLTPDQTTQVRALFADSRTKMEALRSDTSIAPPDRRSQMMTLRQTEEGKLRALLTPDQKTKYDAMEAHRRDEMREHRPEGAPGSPGEAGPPPPPGQPQS